MPISAVVEKKLCSRRAKQARRDVALKLVFLVQPDCHLLPYVVKMVAMEIKEHHPMCYLTTNASCMKNAVPEGSFEPPMSEDKNKQLKWHHENDTKYLMNHGQSAYLICNALETEFPGPISSGVLEMLTNNAGFLELYVCDMERKKRTRFSQN